MENKLERLETKIDTLTEICIENRSGLKNINGTLISHQKSIECHRKKIGIMNNKFNRYIGLGAGIMLSTGVFFTVLQIFILA